ncbi:PH domain-containing protein [Aestuariibacter halophilus]|uniref:PH domain-containing protein n=1 Tax=Fluctibacter halophilus TaxID=226011 RepID=A0ABS8GC81_9ALTE|nr:PH domain-containing protein [Aestuariibacter halophilus]MCC2618003.1 PH domain-containing protein [Aestuariibacter halophilus]
MNTPPLMQANIDDKVKQYWLVLTLIICFCGVVTILALPVIIPLVMFASNKYLAALSVTLHERKLSVKKGVFVKVEKSVPLEKITDISMIQGPLMRLFGLYRLNFETAGQSGEGALVTVIGIIDAEGFRERVLAQKDAIAGVVKSDVPKPQIDDPILASVQSIETMLRELIEQQRSSNKG